MLGSGEGHGWGVFAGAGGGRGADDDYVFGGWEEGSLEGKDGDWVRGDEVGGDGLQAYTILWRFWVFGMFIC